MILVKKKKVKFASRFLTPFFTVKFLIDKSQDMEHLPFFSFLRLRRICLHCFLFHQSYLLFLTSTRIFNSILSLANFGSLLYISTAKL